MLSVTAKPFIGVWHSGRVRFPNLNLNDPAAVQGFIVFLAVPQNSTRTRRHVA